MRCTNWNWPELYSQFRLVFLFSRVWIWFAVQVESEIEFTAIIFRVDMFAVRTKTYLLWYDLVERFEAISWQRKGSYLYIFFIWELHCKIISYVELTCLVQTVHCIQITIYFVAVVVKLICRFYVLLTVHHVMILGKWPTWCTNCFLCIYFYL
jgi:hypothetical protein